MDKLALATLLSWNEAIEGRKRLQKITYLLQAAGYPADANFILHHYGPYSRDISQTSDELVSLKILEEKKRETQWGTVYHYELTDHGRELLLKANASRLEELERFQTLAEEFKPLSTRQLEIGSTIAFFHRQSHDWDEAVRSACQMKKVEGKTDPDLEAAIKVARRTETFATA